MKVTSNFEEFIKGEAIFLIEGIDENNRDACSINNDDYKIKKSVKENIMNLKNKREVLPVCISTTYGGSDCPEIDVLGDLIDINENEIILNPNTVRLRCDATNIRSAKGTYFESGKIIANDVYSLWLVK